MFQILVQLTAELIFGPPVRSNLNVFVRTNLNMIHCQTNTEQAQFPIYRAKYTYTSWDWAEAFLFLFIQSYKYYCY